MQWGTRQHTLRADNSGDSQIAACSTHTPGLGVLERDGGELATPALCQQRIWHAWGILSCLFRAALSCLFTPRAVQRGLCETRNLALSIKTSLFLNWDLFLVFLFVREVLAPESRLLPVSCKQLFSAPFGGNPNNTLSSH